MAANLCIIFALLWVFTTPILAQQPSLDPYISLTIEQTLKKLNEQSLIPTEGEVTVAGNVSVPSRIKVHEYMDVIEAIAICGGPNRDSAQTIRVIGKDENGIYTRQNLVTLKDLQIGVRTVNLRPGDIVIIFKERKRAIFLHRELPLPARIPENYT